ncbi:uncharacterized protein PpBr36_06144 [Pyricularia pennisetigena]|uniref:uncharacterized protein n=1 Tax=Pyricularia pennisetigena TaxID=1578925 RepID=UPI001150EF64|nr:uncharacterized protein PpBr36_06144 [Pyricularia pennisetigena]TLS22842.1 hypothetical protein PpBr36_06144 [Pyricularia pennisetigena]
MTQEATEKNGPQTGSSANTSQKSQHRVLIESFYGETRALQDPDAYIRYLCDKMISQRPWIKFEDIYRHLKCVCTRHSFPVRPGPGCLNNSEGKPSHQIIADFPMSHRCFLTFNRLLDYLNGCFTKHKDWREAVSKHGEVPFDCELFTRGFFAARTALGYGTTRFTLLGGPKERIWTDGIDRSKLGYLNHDPNTPRGQVHPFWAGFYEHQAANWENRIEPAVKEAMRTFGKDRRQELKRKRDDPNDGNTPKPQARYNASSYGHESESSDDLDIKGVPQKAPSKIKGVLFVIQAKQDAAKSSADSVSAAPKSPPTATATIKSETDSPAEAPNEPFVTPTRTVPKTPGKHVDAASPTTLRRSTRLVQSPRGQTPLQSFPAGANAQDGEESDSSVTVGFPTPRRKRV